MTVRTDGLPNGTANGLTLIACGALASELVAITSQFLDGEVELTRIPASWHNHPEKIVPGLRRKVNALGRRRWRVAMVYGDCGTGSGIDGYLEAENVARIPGPHCYEMFLGDALFEDEMERELGTFFLTDYMVRHFERIVMQGMGLRRHPQLCDMYFAHYRRVMYIAQTRDPALEAKAERAAAEIGLAYEYRFAGSGRLTPWVSQAVTAAV